MPRLVDARQKEGLFLPSESDETLRREGDAPPAPPKLLVRFIELSRIGEPQMEPPRCREGEPKEDERDMRDGLLEALRLSANSSPSSPVARRKDARACDAPGCGAPGSAVNGMPAAVVTAWSRTKTLRRCLPTCRGSKTPEYEPSSWSRSTTRSMLSSGALISAWNASPPRTSVAGRARAP